MPPGEDVASLDPRPPVGLPGRFFLAFRSPGYPWLWGNGLFNAAARMLEILAQGWLVLELTDSAFWVGVSAGVRGATVTLFALPGGAVADRVDRRRLLLAAQLGNALITAAVATLAMTGRIEVWHILLASALLGVTMSVQLPARQTLVFDVVGRARLFNANAANFLAVSMMRVLSPALGGLVVAMVGVFGGYYLVAGLSLVGASLLFALPSPTALHRERTPVGRTLMEGAGQAVRPGPVRSLLSVSLVAEIFGYSHMYMLPVIARDVLGVDAAGLGLLMAAGGVGGLVMNLLIASRGEVRAKGRLLVGAIGGFGLFVALFAASPWFALSLALLAVVGGLAVAYDTTQQTLLQSVAPEEARGRVMGLYAFTLGFTPMGGFQVGAVASVLGAPLAVGIGGALVALNALRLVPLARRLNG